MTHVSDVEMTIRALRQSSEGEVCSRARVIDGLLDVRLAAAGRFELVEMVDAALADVPGQTMVPAAWLSEQLDLFEIAALETSTPAEPVA